MVLTTKVGRERNFALVVLLFIVTFGIYGIYWNYKAHNEVYKQFELQAEGKSDGVIWLILGYIVFQPLLWVYHWIFISNTRDVRQRLGFQKSLSPGLFLGLTIGAGVIMFVVFLVSFIPFLIALEDADTDGDGEISDDEADDAFTDALGAFIGTLVIGGLIALALQLVAYGMLQSNLNELWRAYDRRMGQLAAPPAAPAPY